MGAQGANPLARCELHDMQNCDICWGIPEPPYQQGQRLPVPENSYVSIRGGKGVYHHTDCYNVTGDWDGAETATLGERLIHTTDELALGDLRPADCCQPPLFRR